MQVAVGSIFVLLCIGAPWISRGWGWRGGVLWAVAALIFLVFSILTLK
jgi:hypothetical protein